MQQAWQALETHATLRSGSPAKRLERKPPPREEREGRDEEQVTDEVGVLPPAEPRRAVPAMKSMSPLAASGMRTGATPTTAGRTRPTAPVALIVPMAFSWADV